MGRNVKSAIVKYTDKTKSELLEMHFTGKEPDMYSRYTTPDHVFQLGMMGSCILSDERVYYV